MKNRLMKKVLILALLLGAFGYVVIESQSTVDALGCCRDCIAEEEACYLDCQNMYGFGTKGYETCSESCQNMGNACAGTPCDPICSGGCTDSSECGDINCYCTGTRCTCF